MTIEELIARLQGAAKNELGPSAPVYLLLDGRNLHELVIDVLPKGNLGPGSVLFLKGKQP